MNGNPFNDKHMGIKLFDKRIHFKGNRMLADGCREESVEGRECHHLYYTKKN